MADRFQSVERKNQVQELTVTLIDLQKRTDLNGRSGTVRGREPNGRLLVYLDPPDTSKKGKKKKKEKEKAKSQTKTTPVPVAELVPVKLKPSNLIFPWGALVEVVGLTKVRRHNHRIGTVVDYDENTQRYQVQVSYMEVLKLRRDNCVCV